MPRTTTRTWPRSGPNWPVRADHDLTLARIEYERKVAEAQAETDRLRQELADRDALLAERAERIVELQRAVAALTPAPQRAAIEAADGRTVPNQATGEPNAEPERRRRRLGWRT
ncbi:hypothetical protein [Streptomyces sp. NPDC001828]|uniref:hypothetical protein n=1 Tax=Streptomyces sp. NPDC001828 TaxID=3364615 RepID=UPI0036A37B89